jgi:hypothetical protein
MKVIHRLWYKKLSFSMNPQISEVNPKVWSVNPKVFAFNPRDLLFNQEVVILIRKQNTPGYDHPRRVSCFNRKIPQRIYPFVL